MAANIESPRNDFRSTDEALSKRCQNLAIDLWNLSQQFITANRTMADGLELFLNSRYSAKTHYKQADAHLFAAEDQVRAVDQINSLLEQQEEIIGKFRRSEGSFSALKSLASVQGVPELLRLKVIELGRVVPLLRAAMEQDLKEKIKSAQESPFASDDESIALVVLKMENFPRTDMMAPELKDPEHPFPMTQCNKIKAYIAMHYQNDPSNFNAAFSELDDMRSKMIQGINEHELVCLLKRYYAQLTLMKSRFPMELDGDASVNFAWTERSSDNPLPIIIPDINFEICCVMFNIGCLHALIAASQQRNNDDSTKTAFMHFQQAAWPFICLRDELKAQRCGLVDFEDISLTFYANVMLAQAQECILEKSLKDRSPAVISKIAYRIFQLYNSCGNLINNAGFADMMSSSRYKNWTRLCAIKGALYGVIYFHARGQDLSQEQKYGAALACFKAGLDLANEILPVANKDKRTSLKEALVYVKDVIAQREQVARKENDLIYHERIPALTELEEIKGVDMVKALSFKATDPSIAGDDLFKALLPSSVVEVVSLYEEEKAELRRTVLNKCEKVDGELESYLLTLKLDKLNLDQPGECQRLPDELISCYGEFNSEPDCVHNLLEKFHELTTKTSNVECQLADLSSRMRAVNTPQFASSEGYKAISDQLNKLSNQHKQARANNAELQKRLDAHTDNLKLFALSLPELTNEVSGKIIDTSKSPEGQSLRRLLDKVDEMRKQRIRLIAELRDSLEKDDITSHALFDPYSDPKPIIKAQIANHDKAIAVIDQNFAAQANILKALTEANANFADFRQQILETFENKKAKAITLVTAFESFKQIRGNTDKAIQFYDNMLRLLNKLGDGIQNMEEAKKREDEHHQIMLEKEQAKLQSLEVAEFVNEFATPRGQQQIPQSYAPPASSYSSIPQPTSMAGGRPKLGDFMRNRNKGTPTMPVSAPIMPPEAAFIQPAFSQPMHQPALSQPMHQPMQQPTLSQPMHQPIMNQMPTATNYQMPTATNYQMPISQPQIPQMTYQQQYPAQYSAPQSNPYVPAMTQQPIMSTSQHNTQLSQPPQMHYQYPPASQPIVSQPAFQPNQQFASTSQPVHSPQSTYYQPNVPMPAQSQFQSPQPAPTPQNFYSQAVSTPHVAYPQNVPATNGSTNSSFNTPSNGNSIAPSPIQQNVSAPTNLPTPSKSAENELEDFLFGDLTAKSIVSNNGQPASSNGFQPVMNFSPMSQPGSMYSPAKPANSSPSPWHASSINPLLINRNQK